MVFPADDRDVLVEMLRGTSTWTDITADLYERDAIEITRGRSDEGSQAAPSACRFTLNNGPSKVPSTLGRVGCYSPRNPMGPYYGQIGRNTQLRVALQTDPVFDAYSNSSGTGDLSWTHTPSGTPTGVCVMIWQYNSNTQQIAPDAVTYGGVVMERKIFGLFVLGATNMVGYMYWLNRDIPAGPQTIVVDTTATLLRQASAITVRGGDTAEIDNTTQAYTSATPTANPAVNLVTFKRALLLGSLFSELDDGSTISPGVGYTQAGEHDIGTETVNVERASVQAPGTWSINWAAASAHWGIMAVAIRAVYYRYYGEIGDLPQRWDNTGKDAWVPITASGLLRRQGAGNEPAQTGLREYILSKPQSLTSYWPLSGAEGTTVSLNLGKTMEGRTRFFALNFPVYQYGVELGGAIGTVMELNATGPTNYMVGDVATAEDSGVALDFVWQADGLGVLKATVEDYKEPGIKWAVNLNDSTDAGTLFVSYDDGTGPIAFAESAVIPALQDNAIHHCRLQLIVDGADTDYEVFIDGVSVKTGTMAATTWLGTALVYFNYTRYPEVGQTVMNLGHVTVWSENNPAVIPSAADLTAAMRGYAGETAGERMTRIAGLRAIPLSIVGNSADTIPMGPQVSESTMAQIRDAETTDGGILTERRDQLALLYRTRSSQYTQAPAVTLDMSLGHVSPPFEPTDDDQYTRNDVTASNRSGGSARVTKDTGALSAQDPPNGVGSYPDEVTVNTETDAALPNIAQWEVNKGTVDESRYPAVTVDLAKKQIVTAGLEPAILGADVGDRLLLGNPDFINVFDDISLLALGYTETIRPREHRITFYCVPEAPYAAAVYGTSASVGLDRYDTAGSALTSGISSSATSFQVSDTGNTLWTNDAAAFPLDVVIGGERMTVGTITGATSPQTFGSVTRAVNGVTKSHSANADVRLFRPSRYAL